MLSGLVELYKADRDPKLIPEAETTANTTIASATSSSQDAVPGRACNRCFE